MGDVWSRPARILVTSAVGHVGREVVSALATAGFRVRAADVATGLVHGMHGEGIDARRLDYAAPSTFAHAVAGCDGLFLVRPPDVFHMESTLLPFLDAAMAEGVKHVVFMSVEGAAANKLVPHHAVERHLAARTIPHTLLRPGFFAQNLGAAYRDDIADDDRIYLPAGRGRVAFVDLRDLAEAVARIFEEPSAHVSGAYTCTGPEALSFEEAARLLSDVLGRTIRYEPASIAGYVRHLHVRGVPLPQIGVQTLLHVGLRFGQREAIDPTLGVLLGRRPRTLATYVREYAALWSGGVSAPVICPDRPPFLESMHVDRSPSRVTGSLSLGRTPRPRRV
ncbi:MAG: NmrA family NAD(P)-binding protein [Deltaproteobacteria bacterium]|nr:NmrA family NAD(P)-binding protein [Deltaproteobacteria bacterium]